MYVIIDGNFDCEVVGAAGGAPQLVAQMWAGCVGDVALLHQTSRVSTVRARKRSVVARLHRKHYQGVCLHQPHDVASSRVTFLRSVPMLKTVGATPRTERERRAQLSPSATPTTRRSGTSPSTEEKVSARAAAAFSR